MESALFPFSARRATGLREKGEARSAWAAAGARPDQLLLGIPSKVSFSKYQPVSLTFRASKVLATEKCG